MFFFGRSKKKETPEEQRRRTELETLKRGLPAATWAADGNSFDVQISTAYGSLRMTTTVPPDFPTTPFTCRVRRSIELNSNSPFIMRFRLSCKSR